MNSPDATLEQAADEVERRLREAHPEVRHVFLDPTDLPDGETPVPGPTSTS